MRGRLGMQGKKRKKEWRGDRGGREREIWGEQTAQSEGGLRRREEGERES